MAETLSALGFTLIGSRAQLDLDKPAMDLAVQTFGRQVQGADVALFYYAGHGVQVSGSNYLVPVTANPTREADVDFQMVDVNLVLRQMQGSGTRLNMVILDACRNNPFGARGLRASDGGLAQMRAPEGTLISYATQPGNVALDGADGHSPYTRALASTIKQAGARHLPDLQPGRPRRKAPDRRLATALGVLLADRRQLSILCPLLPRRRSRWRRPPMRRSPRRCAPIPTASRSRIPSCCANSATACSSSITIRSRRTARTACGWRSRKFQEKAKMTPTGEATEGVLTRLRKMDDLKPWALDRLRPRQRQMGNVLELCIAAGGHRRRTQELRREQMSARIEFLRIAMRRVCDFGQILVAGPARYRCSAPKTQRLTSAARLANLAALLARSVPTGQAANFSFKVLEAPLMRDAVRHSTGIALLSLFVSVASGTGVAQAQSGSAGGSIGNDEKSLSGSREAPRATEAPARATNPRRKNRAAHRERAVAAAATFRWRVDCELRGRHVFGHQQQRGRRHQRQDYRSDCQRHRPSRRTGVRDLEWKWPDRHHGRPPVRSQRRWNVQAIGRVHRKVDGGKTIALLRAHLDTHPFGYWNKSLWNVQFNVRSELHSSRFWSRPP